jgi:hypothetical protein
VSCRRVEIGAQLEAIGATVDGGEASSSVSTAASIRTFMRRVERRDAPLSRRGCVIAYWEEHLARVRCQPSVLPALRICHHVSHSELTRDAVVSSTPGCSRLERARRRRVRRAVRASGSTVGFDGSQLDGRDAIRSELARIFADHVDGDLRRQGARGARPRPGRDAAARRRRHGAAGKSALMPERNAVQSLVAVTGETAQPRIAMYQNTPARFDGRPQLGEQLTAS